MTEGERLPRIDVEAWRRGSNATVVKKTDDTGESLALFYLGRFSRRAEIFGAVWDLS